MLTECEQHLPTTISLRFFVLAVNSKCKSKASSVYHILTGDDSLDPLNPSLGSGLERETIHTALNMFLSDAGQWFVPTDEGRLTLAISMPLRLASAIAPSRLEELRVLGALVSLSLISGKPPGPITPALLQYALNDRCLESLTPEFVATWHPTVAGIAQAMQTVGPHGSLLPFQSEIINFLNIQVSE